MRTSSSFFPFLKPKQIKRHANALVYPYPSLHSTRFRHTTWPQDALVDVFTSGAYFLIVSSSDTVSIGRGMAVNEFPGSPFATVVKTDLVNAGE